MPQRRRFARRFYNECERRADAPFNAYLAASQSAESTNAGFASAG